MDECQQLPPRLRVSYAGHDAGSHPRVQARGTHVGCVRKRPEADVEVVEGFGRVLSAFIKRHAVQRDVPLRSNVIRDAVDDVRGR